MLSNEYVNLRAPEPADIEFVYGLENDAKLWNVSNTHNPFSRFDIEQYVMMIDKDIYSAKQLRFIIEKKGDNSFNVGTIDIFDFDVHNRRCGIGITIIDEFRKLGYAKMALDICVNYIFKHLNIHQIYCNIDFDNFASIKLFTNAGFEISGVKKEWNLRNKEWIDVNFYQKINNNQ